MTTRTMKQILADKEAAQAARERTRQQLKAIVRRLRQERQAAEDQPWDVKTRHRWTSLQETGAEPSW